jgi:hypothetical protein
MNFSKQHAKLCPGLIGQGFRLLSQYQVHFIESLVNEDGSPSSTLLGLLGIDCYYPANEHYTQDKYKSESNQFGFNFCIPNWGNVSLLVFIRDTQVMGRIVDSLGKTVDKPIWQVIEYLELTIPLMM